MSSVPQLVQELEGKSHFPLDLFSTTQTNISDGLLADIEFEVEQSHALQEQSCERGAPHICYPDGEGRWRLSQGCCNNWLCRRCGHIRARQEFARIVNGAVELAKEHQLYFVTITCRGKEMPLAEAEAGYAKWTNRLVTAMSTQARRKGSKWAYVQVTERQKREHPHSHFITTFLPHDAVLTHEPRKGKAGEYQAEVYISKWFIERNVSAGLGNQCKIEPVQNPVGLAAYVAKYLFKECMSTEWTSGWKRIRYSQSWPKLPDVSSPEGFPVLKPSDWARVAALPHLVFADSQITYERALARLITNVIFTG